MRHNVKHNLDQKVVYNIIVKIGSAVNNKFSLCSL